MGKYRVRFSVEIEVTAEDEKSAVKKAVDQLVVKMWTKGALALFDIEVEEV